jgi:hypothetical protein
MRYDAMRCDAMRCDAMRCDAMRCDAMRCDVFIDASDVCHASFVEYEVLLPAAAGGWFQSTESFGFDSSRSLVGSTHTVGATTVEPVDLGAVGVCAHYFSYPIELHLCRPESRLGAGQAHVVLAVIAGLVRAVVLLLRVCGVICNRLLPLLSLSLTLSAVVVSIDPSPPVIVISVFSRDGWGRCTAVGYGSHPLPVLPGVQELEVLCMRYFWHRCCSC